MPPEFVALIDKPLLLLILLGVGAAIGIAIERAVESQKRAGRRAYWAGRNAKKAKRGEALPWAKKAEPVVDFAAEQLKAVMKADFTPRALLNRAEARLFKALDEEVVARNPGWQVMAQVSLGEFLASEDKAAYLAINSKRVDFALMDPDCRVQHTLEYQGTGHYQGSAAARDAVKKEALRKAGIRCHPIDAGHMTRSDLRRLVEKLVPAQTPQPA